MFDPDVAHVVLLLPFLVITAPPGSALFVRHGGARARARAPVGLRRKAGYPSLRYVGPLLGGVGHSAGGVARISGGRR